MLLRICCVFEGVLVLYLAVKACFHLHKLLKIVIAMILTRELFWDQRLFLQFHLWWQWHYWHMKLTDWTYSILVEVQRASFSSSSANKPDLNVEITCSSHWTSRLWTLWPAGFCSFLWMASTTNQCLLSVSLTGWSGLETRFRGRGNTRYSSFLHVNCVIDVLLTCFCEGSHALVEAAPATHLLLTLAKR